jgi:hypothetical protein
MLTNRNKSHPHHHSQDESKHPQLNLIQIQSIKREMGETEAIGAA